MKKLIFISLALLCYLNVTTAQVQYKNHNLTTKKIKDIAIQSEQQYFESKTLKERNYLTKTPKTKSLIWRPDTIITYDTLNNLYERHTRTFDNHGNSLVELIEVWVFNAWENGVRFTYTYDTHGNELTMLFETWDTNGWINDIKITRTYNSNGNMILVILEQWESGAWANYQKGILTYDSNGNELTSTVQQWDVNAWLNNERYTSTYNINNKILTYLYEVWQTSAWENSGKDTYTYDANGNVVTDLYQDWQTNAWVNAGRDTYTYDVHGNELTDLYEQWQTSSWENSNRATFTYDANGNTLIEFYEDWQSSINSNTKAWEIAQINTYTYDSNENISTVLIELSQNFKATSSTKYSFTYDSNGNSLTGKCENLISTNWLPQMGLIPIFSVKENIYEVYAYSYQAHYKSFASGISEISVNRSLFVFPNPATNYITVNCTSLNENKETMISVFNTQGQLLMQVPILQENQNIDISGLASGVYFLKLKNNVNTNVVKVIKE
jgi:hypothetical protein